MPLLARVVPALCLLAAPVAVAGEAPPAKWTGRLGASVVPRAQAVSLDLDLAGGTYRGSTRIDVDVVERAERFVLHAEGMTLERIAVEGPPGALAATARPLAGDAVEIVPAAPLDPGPWRLRVDFARPFGDGATGLYRVEEGGRPYAFTQFESDDAREAFPCFDEPDFKIPFRVDVTVADGNVVVANAPLEAERAQGGRRTFVFAATPPLPTYLVAVAAGPFEFVEIPGMSVPGRVVVPRGRAALAGPARDATPAILARLEAWFDRPHPFAKLDLVAVPRFWPGAMENAGLITFRDTSLLKDPESTGPSERLGLRRIIAHELAHQWFGNLVTMRWWDDLWLNETFADWMADEIVDGLHPEAALPVQQVVRTQAFLAGDARATARPIRRDVQGVEDLLQGVGLAYAKGKRVLAMFERWLGEDDFRRAVLAYLDAHAWDNASAGDLWRALDEASGRSVAETLAPFLEQPGFPCVAVDVAEGGRVLLSQERFRGAGVTTPDLRWKVPVVLRWSDDAGVHERSLRLEGATTAVDLPVSGELRWLYPNGGALGYYRWTVPDALWPALLEAPLDPLERAERLGNLRALMEAGKAPADRVLAALARAAGDEHPRVVEAACAMLDDFRETFVDESLEDAWAAWVRAAFAPSRERIGLAPRAGESVVAAMARGDLLRALGDHGRDREVRALALAAAREGPDDPRLRGELAGTLLDLAALDGDAALFDAYVRRFEAEGPPAERVRYLEALARFTDPALADRALRYALEGPVPAQHVLTVAVRMAERGGPGRGRAFDWVTAEFPRLRAVVPGPQLPRVTGVVGGSDPALVERARRFFGREENAALGVPAALERAGAAVEERAGLRAREGARVRAALLD